MNDRIAALIEKATGRNVCQDRVGYRMEFFVPEVRAVAEAAYQHANLEIDRIIAETAASVRRELAKELLGFFEAKKHEYGHKETALIMLLGEIDGIAGEGEE